MKQRFLDWLLQVDLDLEDYSDTGIMRIGQSCIGWMEQGRYLTMKPLGYFGNEPNEFKKGE